MNADMAFSIDGDKIQLPITEVLLHAASGNLASSKKQRDWAPLNTVLILPLLTEATILDGETSTEYLLNIFARGIIDILAEEDKENGE